MNISNKGMVTVKTKHSPDAIRVAATFEAAKGLIVLFAGSGLFMLIHKDIHSVAEQSVRHPKLLLYCLTAWTFHTFRNNHLYEN